MLSSRASATCFGPDTFAALLDGEIDAAARGRAERHVDGCEACRRMLAAVAQLSESSTRPEGRRAADSWLTTMPRGMPRGEPRFASGDRVGPFQIARLLGRGGMGEVYLAHDPRLGRSVALKMVGESQLHTPRAVERFLREARMTARLNHPNIVTIHDVGEHGGRPYLALEYVEGKTLRQWAREGRARSWRSVVEIGLAIAEALVAAHRSGVLHRDLKPENVLVAADGRVRVVDFGLAEPIDTTQVDIGSTSACVTTMAGTPRYMAPEQWRGEIITGATDVWALGVILYEALCDGEHPWGSNEPSVLASAVAVCEPIAPIPAHAAPAPLRKLCERCLAHAPEHRPSAAEVAKALHQLLERREHRRGRALWVSLVLALATTAAVAQAAREPRVVSTLATSLPTAAAAPIAKPTKPASTRRNDLASTPPKTKPRSAAPPVRDGDDWLRQWE